jgi:two-component system response regulator FixJ
MALQRTIYVIDDDLASRRVLTESLARVGAEAWPFASGKDFLAILDHLSPGCVLLDMNVANPAGLEILAEIGRRRPGWPVLAMSQAPEIQVVVEAMKLGAQDFLTKPFGAGVLAAALGPACAGLETALESSERRRRAGERMGRLSPRERDIALALFGGQSNKAVAHLLGISVRTVEMHRAHIMGKLGVKTLAEAAVLATQAGLTSTTPRIQPRPVAEVATLIPRRAGSRF